MTFAIFKRLKYYKPYKSSFRPVSKWEYIEGTKTDNYEKAEKKKRTAIINQTRYCDSSKVEFKIFKLDANGNKILDPPPDYILRMFHNEVVAFE